MIDVVPANAKLRDRVIRIVAEIAERPLDVARAGLERCEWNARATVVHLTEGLSPSRRRACRTSSDVARGDGRVYEPLKPGECLLPALADPPRRRSARCFQLPKSLVTRAEKV